MSDSDLVAVMVPKRHLAKVYGFVAKLDDNDDAGSAIAHAPAGSPSPDEWTPMRVRKAVQESPPGMRDILRALAERPGEWLNTHDLAAAHKGNAQADWKTIAGTLGAFGRRVANRYGLETLPFERRHDHVVGGTVSRMSAAMASQVLQALDNGD